MTVQATTGDRIEQARTQAGLSASELAQRIGVKRKTLENWEGDRSEPRGNQFMRLAGVLQVPLIWLLAGEEPKGAEADPGASDTVGIVHKLDRAITMQRELAALLTEISADVDGMQKELNETQDAAA